MTGGKILTYTVAYPGAFPAGPAAKSRGMPVPHDTVRDLIWKKRWRGKTVLVDLDHTLIETDQVPSVTKMEKREGTGTRTDFTTTSEGRRCKFTITKINEVAKDVLQNMRLWGARVYITSAADDEYVRKATKLSGFSEIVDGAYGWSKMVHLMGKRWGVSPKDYRPVLEEIGEKHPLRNCAVIGNKAESDVPVYPKGMVSIISSDMEILFIDTLMLLCRMLEDGGNDFSHGFDYFINRIQRGERVFAIDYCEEYRTIKTDDWRFDKRTTGFARVLEIKTEKGPDAMKRNGG